jgi:MoaA/NifB/PqqE/SkfB family radical SAM enzyme
MLAPALADSPPLKRLPLVTLYATERCNSRCISCDYWQHGRLDLSMARVEALASSFRKFGTRMVLFSGGEPLLNPRWSQIAQRLREAGLRLWLLTSGLSLAKHAPRVAELFDEVTVSLDGTDPQTYAAIRGLDAFDVVCEGIRAVAALGTPVGIRVTVQRRNFLQMSGFVELAQVLGARSVSFLTIDVANPHAFARAGGVPQQLALSREDLPLFDEVLFRLEHDHRAAFRSKFILESPQKLRRQLNYFKAVLGEDEYPAVRCNAPEFSAVVGADGRVQPCFFIAAPPGAVAEGLAEQLNSAAMQSLRTAIRRGERPECRGCVCSLWRDPKTLHATFRGTDA